MSQIHETAPNMSVDVGNQRYAYRRFGPGGELPLLFLQHFRGTMDYWDPQVINAFAAHREVILFDYAGVGGSSGSPSSTVADMAQQVAEFLAALELTQVDLVGFSLGGFVAQQVAVDRPSLVRRLVLAGTGPRGGNGMAGYTDEVVTHATPDVFTDDDFLFLFFSPSQSSQAAGAAFLKRRASRTGEPDGPTGTAVRDAQLGAIAEWGASTGGNYSYLETIHQPTFVANGTRDLMVPSVNSLILSQNMPSALLSLYPDAGHGAIFQYPELFTDQAIRFLSS
ncbi:alpha/beta fold hydrolase [Sphingomonas sp. PAMC 26605]|uniref:alpha/beta fold hydrolase n=1 Tax=Sphingomonas sp. PAMC 26605 TaxID=1112214 RepID=UPI0004983F43|nr:alpha/beta hydrolase [Sphingomonas sp. PAMC 26605]